MFHVCQRVNRHNYHVWKSENLHEDMEHKHESPKTNMWCAVTRTYIISPFFFKKPILTDETFPITTEGTALHHIHAGTDFQSDGTTPQFSHHLLASLDRRAS
jgi:hypothetical protein